MWNLEKKKKRRGLTLRRLLVGVKEVACIWYFNSSTGKDCVMKESAYGMNCRVRERERESWKVFAGVAMKSRAGKGRRKKEGIFMKTQGVGPTQKDAYVINHPLPFLPLETQNENRFLRNCGPLTWKILSNTTQTTCYHSLTFLTLVNTQLTSSPLQQSLHAPAPTYIHTYILVLLPLYTTQHTLNTHLR